MSERPTDTQPSRAAAADGRGHHAGHDARARHAGAGQQSVADRAASFRQGAPFLVERATLYDPEPLPPLSTPSSRSELNPGRLLPAALTLLGVVVVVGLTAGVLFVRNADVARYDDETGRLGKFSEKTLPRSDEDRGKGPGSLAYDLTRRPHEVIVGAWRPPPEAEPPAARQRRALPRRMSAAPPDVPPEAITRPVATPETPRAVPAETQPKAVAQGEAPSTPASSRYDAPEPARRLADGEPAQSGPNVVARVGRASEPLEAEGSQVAIPLDKLALPLRRPDPDRAGARRERHPQASQTRRSSLLRLQRQLRRQQRHARKRAYDQKAWSSEALYGNRFHGLEQLLP